MATALVYKIQDGIIERGATTLQLEILYFGGDVPGTIQKVSLNVDMSAYSGIASIATIAAAAVRAKAVINGYTVGANLVLLPAFSAS